MKIFVHRSALFLSTVVVLTACDIGDIPPVSGETPPAPSDAVVKNFFEENRTALDSYVQFCNENPAVTWLGANKDEVDFAFQQQGVNTKDVEVIRKSLRQFDIRSIRCGRDRRLPNPPLHAVWVPLYSVGISVSGSTRGVLYSAGPQEKNHSRLEIGEYVSLGEDGWYITGE